MSVFLGNVYLMRHDFHYGKFVNYKTDKFFEIEYLGLGKFSIDTIFYEKVFLGSDYRKISRKTGLFVYEICIDTKRFCSTKCHPVFFDM